MALLFTDPGDWGYQEHFSWNSVVSRSLSGLRWIVILPGMPDMRCEAYPPLILVGPYRGCGAQVLVAGDLDFFVPVSPYPLLPGRWDHKRSSQTPATAREGAVHGCESPLCAGQGHEGCLRIHPTSFASAVVLRGFGYPGTRMGSMRGMLPSLLISAGLIVTVPHDAALCGLCCRGRAVGVFSQARFTIYPVEI